MKNKYLNILFLFAICCFSFQNVNAQCTDNFGGGPYLDFNNDFNGAPCDDGGVCPFNEIGGFEIWAAEAYTIDNFVAGVSYTFSACNGTGGAAWPLEFTIVAPSGAVDAVGLDAGSNCALTWTASESGTYLVYVNEAGACGTTTNTATNNGFPALTCSGTAPACAPVTVDCSASFDGAASDCDGDVVFGAGCSLDNDFVTAGNVAQFEIFYETDGTGGGGILDAVSGYTTGAEILANLNSGAAGEVVFFGNPGDCTELTSVFGNGSCTPFTLDVYVSTIEYNAAGDPAAINGDCPVERITLVFNPEQEFITVLETAGDCDSLATAIVGFDNGDGAGGAPDGDLDDAEDFICGTYESAPAIAYPCGTGGDNTSTIPTVAAADLATLLGDADPACYTDLAFTATAVCPSVACPACDAAAPALAAVAPECPDGTTVTLGVTGGSANAGEITEYIITDPATGLITAVTPDATGNVAGLAVGEEICVTAITHVQAELDQIVNDLDACTGGIVIAALGLSASGNTLQAVYEGVDNSPLVGPATLTIDDVLALIGGVAGGTGPGLGGLADLSVLSPGLMCPILPFCFNLSATECITGVEAPVCDVCADAVPTACDDGDACTTGEMETLGSDGSVCVPCGGGTAVTDCSCTGVATACDDGDPCTTGEMETVADNGDVCVPCGGGTAVEDCSCTGTASACDDGDPCTTGEMETVAANGDVCVPCGGGTAVEDCSCTGTAQACDDGDPCTTGEMETVATNGDVCVPCGGGTAVEDCSCTGTAQACDDGDTNTINDMETVADNGDVCVPCAGTPVSCSDPTTDLPCDDGDDCTENDMQTVLTADNSIICVPCAGTAVLDCNCTSTVQACDDGDPCTTGETETVADNGDVCVPCGGGTAVEDCSCTGTASACDDNDPCTENDMETVADNGDVCVPCAGTPVAPITCPDGQEYDDAICACVDEMNPCLDATPIACDDGDPCTTGEMETIAADGTECVPCGGGTAVEDCSCTGTEVACDDGNDCTEGETETVAANGDVCVPCGNGTPVDSPECACPGATAQACDDGDPCTTGEMETVDGDGNICIPCGNGTAVEDCSCTGTASVCDDGDDCTENDTETVAANGDVCVPCAGTAIDGCGDVSLGIGDPCNCFAGLDLDGDGENEFARDVITITPGMAPYSVSSYSGGLFDANGNALSTADLDALIAAAVAAGGNIGITVYLPADGSSTYTVEVTDANGSSASITGGGCSSCGDNAIPTMGEWGLIILALLLLNLGVLYIRQTEMKIVSE